jgi:CDP-2,3-bis-(O-geranylgeranyl)-sn-glycerol synthase
MQPELAVKVLVLLAVANGAPVIAKRLLGEVLSYPLDCGKVFVDGRPLLGPSKTIRGVIVSVCAASLIAPTVGLAWTTGLVVGVAAMAGDALSSFIKRRLGLPTSSKATGLDQIPESLIPTLACKNLLAFTMVDVVVIVGLFAVGEIILSRLLFSMHVREQPY